MIHDGLWCAFEDWHMGEAAEHIADRAASPRGAGPLRRQSHQRAAAAWERRRLRRRDRPGHGPQRGDREDRSPTRRGGPRATRPRAAGEAEAGVQTDGTVTAGNASALSDGAAAWSSAADRGQRHSG